MTAIQGLATAIPGNTTAAGQITQADESSVEPFGASMLLALLAPSGTPVVSRAVQASATNPTGGSKPQVQTSDPEQPAPRSTANRAGANDAGLAQLVARPLPKVDVLPEPSGGTRQPPSQTSHASPSKVGVHASVMTDFSSATTFRRTAPTTAAQTLATAIGNTTQEVAVAALPGRQQPTGPTGTQPSAMAQSMLVMEGHPEVEIQVESVEAAGPQRTRPDATMRPAPPPSANPAPNASTVHARPTDAGPTTVTPSVTSRPEVQVPNAAVQQDGNPGLVSERDANSQTNQRTVSSDLARSVGLPGQPQEVRRRVSQAAREGGLRRRDMQGTPRAAATGGEVIGTTPRGDSPAAERVTLRTGREMSNSPERDDTPRVHTSGRQPSQGESFSSMVNTRSVSGGERVISRPAAENQVEQAAPRARVEDPTTLPKPEDRVTIRFTDSDGVDGRLRVAVRGQTVRATIVSSDQAAADRIGAGVNELQQALDKHGFKEAQITVQHSRNPVEANGISVASPVRVGQEAVASAPTSRGLEDQPQRERQQGGLRDHDQQNNGRSGQRSRHPQER